MIQLQDHATVLYDDSATVLERYEYDAYGQATILDADFSDDGDGVSDHEQHHLFAGYRHDAESGLYEVRNRMLHPTLGRWMQRDPLGYVDGMNVYAYAATASPTVGTDPFGLCWIKRFRCTLVEDVIDDQEDQRYCRYQCVEISLKREREQRNTNVFCGDLPYPYIFWESEIVGQGFWRGLGDMVPLCDPDPLPCRQQYEVGPKLFHDP